MHIPGDWRQGDWGDYVGWRLFINGEPTDLVVGDVVNLSVEDVPDPLPTEPGVRFWGKAQDHPAEWWFTVESVRQGVDVYYIASSGMSIHDANDVGLVRLPDPEATP